MDKHTVIERNGEIPTVDLDGEVGMMNTETGNYYGLDSVGSRIWELIAAPITIGGLVETLMKEYEVDEATCEVHVSLFLQELIAEGLVKFQ